MLIWTITTAFSGVFQPLVWLDNADGTDTEQRLVWALLVLSIAGMAGNVSHDVLAHLNCSVGVRGIFSAR